jgi:hypothetical protein
MLGTQFLSVRAAILARFAPLALLLHEVGAADGFTQRAIRRACGGRELASLYLTPEYLIRLHLTTRPDSAKAAADCHVGRERTRPKADIDSL